MKDFSHVGNSENRIEGFSMQAVNVRFSRNVGVNADCFCFMELWAFLISFLSLILEALARISETLAVRSTPMRCRHSELFIRVSI